MSYSSGRMSFAFLMTVMPGVPFTLVVPVPLPQSESARENSTQTNGALHCFNLTAIKSNVASPTATALVAVLKRGYAD